MTAEPPPKGYVQALWCHIHYKNERAWGWFTQILGGLACGECNHMYRTKLHFILATAIKRFKVGMELHYILRFKTAHHCAHCAHDF